MTYVVVTGANRKEFENINEAVEYSTIQSRIYESDAFGNMTPMNQDRIDAAIASEPIKTDQTIVQPAAEAAQTDTAAQQTKEPSSAPEAKPAMAGQPPDKHLVNLKDIDEKEGVKPEKEKTKLKTDFNIWNTLITIIAVAILVYVGYKILSPFIQEFTESQINNAVGIP